ncbi:MAG: S8 family serine peptidase [Phycisphaerales bacterium JB037]
MAFGRHRDVQDQGSFGNPLETLEPRVLLSGTNPQIDNPTVAVEWLDGEIQAIQGSYVLSFHDALGTEGAEAAALRAAAQLGLSVDSVRAIARGYFAELRTSSPIDSFAARSMVEHEDWLVGFEPNRVAEVARVPNDPFFNEQWQLENTGQFIPGSGLGTIGADANLPAAWDLTVGSRDAIVAVIDTGIDIDHPDLADNLWVNPGEIPGNGIDDDGNGFIDDIHGWDFGENDSNPDDVAGHGTAVAGTIGAVGNNGIGVAGVAWNVSLMGLKIADEFGRLSIAAIIGAHDYATQMIQRGTNIVASNNSYGAFAPAFYEDQFFTAEKEAIQRFIDTGAVFVASAGNNGADIDPIDEQDRVAFPAGYDIPGIVSVAAVDNNDTIAGFSNFGAENVDLAGPGVNVRTTAVGGGYTYISGTSFSGPMVAGAVALLKSLRPGSSGEEIRQILIDSSRQLPSLQNKVQSGGTLDVAEALRILGIDGPVVTAVNPGPVTGQVANDGNPLDTVSLSFNRDLNTSILNSGFVSLVGAGSDGNFGTGDDLNIPVSGISALNARDIEIDLNLASFIQQRLPIGEYRLTLNAAGFRDTNGNFLNGDSISGTDQVYNFRVAASSGSFEPNDTLGTAEELPPFIGSGNATLTGLRIGDGVQAGLDVDLFAIDLPRGGLIRAETIAQNRVGGSTLDTYLRLFNSAGEELASNDQFNGQDSLVDFFVSTGGVYYIGVSGFPNTNYDVNIAGSGVSQSTGLYDLHIDVQLIQEDRVTVTQDLSSNPKRVPPQGSQGITSDQLQFNDSRRISDLNVNLDIAHDFTGDLEISLISPQGTEVTLINRRGGAGSDFTATLLDDESTVPISSGTAPFSRTGGYRPEEALSDFDGESAGGTWTLVINDRAALNTGFLLGWSLDFTLENNIFGPFESNDTTVTARDLDTINGTGSASVDAEIGDGGFGFFDRDIFSFVVDAGSTLNATASPTGVGTLNTALRLFDANANELIVASPTGSQTASIGNFVFVEGGTYYLAVSDGSNVSYDPEIVGSGAPSQSTGAYNLEITVSPGVTDSARLLSGDSLTTAHGSDGTFRLGGTGLRFNGTEFLFDQDNPGSSFHFFGGAANGFTFKNDGPGNDNGLALALTDESDTINRRFVSAGQFRGLDVSRAVSYGIDDNFIAIDVTLTNNNTTTVNNVTWMEAINADQGLNLSPGTTKNTANDILNGSPFMSSTFTNSVFLDGLSLALAAPASDARASATFFDNSLVVRDPQQLLDVAGNDPDGAVADLAMGLAYDLGNLATGQSTSLRYFLFFGSSAEVADLYDQVNNNTGTGHLAADRGSPAPEDLLTAPGDPVTTAPTLPYRVYYPEGFANENTSTFVPIANPNSQETRVVVIARYETGDRDEVIGDFTIAPNARSGLTITTPDLFAAGQSLVRGLTPYSVEVRSELPVAASFSHYDSFLVQGQSGLGESFINRVDRNWAFGEVQRGPEVRDFLLFQNTTDGPVKITTTLFDEAGDSFSITRTIEANRRGGLDINALRFDGSPLANGAYGVLVQAEGEIVAVLSHFDNVNAGASGSAGVPGGGDTSGAIPEGQLGLRSGSERLSILNANGADTEVLLSFLFQNGTSYRTIVEVDAQSRKGIDVASLPNFPIGQPYSVTFESDLPVALTLPTAAFGDEFAASFSDRAYSLWSFGEGFRPKNGTSVQEYLRLYNPSDSDILAEITLQFDGGLGQETFRRVLPARRVQEFDIFDFVTGDRRNQRVFYSITVKASAPIVAYMGHFDSFFPGGFGTLGTPLGTPIQLT